MKTRSFANRFGLIALLSLSLFASTAFAGNGPTQVVVTNTPAQPMPSAQNASAGDVLSQKTQNSAPAAPYACLSTYTSGSGQTYLSFCVTQNGNLANFYSPSGYHQLYANAEGYAVCDYDYNYSYYDWGQYGDSGNWQNATISQPNGANTFPLTIKRTTSDGNWTLTQAFSRNANTPSVTVKMTLRNSSAVARTAYFMRFADIDADNRTTNEFEGGMASIWGYQSGSTGLMMRESWTYSMGTWVLSSLPGNPCSLQHEGIPYLGDAKGMATWFHGLAANSSMTVSVEYRPIN